MLERSPTLNDLNSTNNRSRPQNSLHLPPSQQITTSTIKPKCPQDVHLRRPRHRRQNRPSQPSRKGLFPSRPRRRMPTAHEAIPALPQDCPWSQLARVSRAEQELPKLSHGERPDGAGRDEEPGLCGGTDGNRRCGEGH
jgi:hypothetical protein